MLKQEIGKGGDVMDKQVWIQHERKIRQAVKTISALLTLAVLALLFPFFDVLRPVGESMATWWQRAGAPVAVFAFMARTSPNISGLCLRPAHLLAQKWRL